MSNLRHLIKKEYASVNNWRLTGLRFGIGKTMAWRIANDSEYEPRSAKIRKQLGLPALVEIEPCECGEVHTTKTCPHKRRKRPPRIAIRKDDVSSAAKSIINNCPPEFVRALVEELSE